MTLVAGRYRIVRELGRGNMGLVLLARQVNLDRLVVLKRVLPGTTLRHGVRLIEEARLAARLHHPCIVDVLDVHTDDGVVIAMEYVAGVTLREMIARAKTGLPAAVALTIAVDVLRGLAYAHGVRHGAHAGVIHRDVKPRNIVVTFAGDTKLIDFGISRWLSDDGAWDATSISGTYGYMPPEQQRGGRVDGRADQYALAVTLREMLTGAPPAEPVPIEPAELAAIVTRACAERPDDRYATCSELAAALDEHARASGLALSPTAVARWLADHMADRVAAWHAEAERESQPTVPPPKPADPTIPTEHTASPPTEHTASPPTDTGDVRPPTRRRRPGRAVAAIAGVALAAGAGVAGWKLRPRASASAPLIVRLAPAAATGDDAPLALAAQRMLQRALRDHEPRRFWVAEPGELRDALPIEISARASASGVRVEARRAGALIAGVDSSSIAEAVDQLAPAVAGALGAGQGELGPDAGEAAGMKKIGARSLAEYRRYRATAEQSRLAGWRDIAVVRDAWAALVRDDPTWPRPYLELAMVRGPDAQQPRPPLDATRDPVAMQLLDVLAANAARRFDDAAKLAEPLFRADDSELLAGEALATSWSALGRLDETRAVLRRMGEVHPELSYTANAAIALELEGRADQAEQTLRAALARAPENLPAARELIRLEAERGDLAAARRDARTMALVHGERPLALSDEFDAMMTIDDLATAQRLADRMLLGSPLVRARGRYRSAVIAVLEGRFTAALQLARAAADEQRPFGHEGELARCDVLLWDLGDGATASAALDELATWFGESHAPAAAAALRYDKAILERGAACPAIDPFLAPLAADDRDIARRDMTRTAAFAGCASCKQVLALGDGPTSVARSLIAFGRCARERGDLDTARHAFERAAGNWATWASDLASPYYSVLARHELAGVLDAQGDHAAAKAEYQRVLRYWDHADRPIPELDDTRRALAK